MAINADGGVGERLEEILVRADHDPRRLDGRADLLLRARRGGLSGAAGSPEHPADLKNCTEALVLTQPKMIEDIHRAYLEAGADIIETDTFNGNAVSLEEFGLQDHVVELNTTAAELARRAADDFTRKDPDKPRFVAGSIGPTKKQLSMGIHVDDPGRRDVTFDEMVANYTEQIARPGRGGVDILLPETSFDTLVMKACLFAIDKYFDETGTRLPVMISGTIFDNGRTLSAQPVEAFYYSVSHFDALSVGLNCAVGVDLMRGLDREPVGDLPDAGQLLPQRRHARRLRRLPRRQGPHGGRRSASSPATAGSTSSAAAAARRPNGSRRSPRPSRASPPRKVPDLPHWSTYSGMEPLVDPPRDQLRHDRRADQHHRLEEVRPPDQGAATSRPRWPSPASRSRAAPTSSTSTWTRA